MISAPVSGEQLFEVAFEHALAEVSRLGGMAGGPFGILAHVKQHGLGIGREARSRLVEGEFADARHGLVDNLQKARRMIHDQTVAGTLRRVKIKTQSSALLMRRTS